MFHTLMATELIVRDLATCTAFYRDILGLEVREREHVRFGLVPDRQRVFFPARGKRGRADGQFGAA